MLRILITYILPLVLPSILFFGWASWVRKKIAAQHAQAQADDDTITADEIAAYDIKAPWFRLILAGIILMGIGLLLSVFLAPPNPPDSVYVAPRIENGKVIPGHYEATPN